MAVQCIQYTSVSKYYSVCQANNRVLYNSLLWVVREEGGGREDVWASTVPVTLETTQHCRPSSPLLKISSSTIRGQYSVGLRPPADDNLKEDGGASKVSV